MPELPEVETVMRGIAPVLEGHVIQRVVLARAGLRTPFPPGLAQYLEGQRIGPLFRRAKYILAPLDQGGILVFHLGMSGQMTAVPSIQEYTPLKHDHLLLTLDNGAGIIFNDARRFGMVFTVENRAALDTHPAFKALGPEPLSKDFTGSALAARLSGKKTPVKIALLDQRVVAGIGNIYASEALFDAKISPLRIAGDISGPEAARLADTVRAVLMRAIKAGGSTLRDYRQSDGALGYFQHSFCVYDRKGIACPRCATDMKRPPLIEKIVQGGRATYYCPRCQK